MVGIAIFTILCRHTLSTFYRHRIDPGKKGNSKHSCKTANTFRSIKAYGGI